MTTDEQPVVAVSNGKGRASISFALAVRGNGTADEKPVAGSDSLEGAGYGGGVSHVDAPH
jgi:hypothetical protein